MGELSSSSIEEEERAARRGLLPELKDHLGLIGDVYNLIGRVNVTFNDQEIARIPLYTKVRLVLLARLADDLICLGKLCEVGYGAQACTLAASVFEIAHTIVYIGTDVARTTAWRDHDDPTALFKSISELVQSNVNKSQSPEPDTQYKSEYRVYRQLCWLKHANPLLMDFRDYRSWETHGTLDYGPNTSEEGVRRSWFALEHTARLGLFALASIINRDLSEEERARFTRPMVGCTRTFDELKERAKKRWGTELPFQGRW